MNVGQIRTKVELSGQHEQLNHQELSINVCWCLGENTN